MTYITPVFLDNQSCLLYLSENNQQNKKLTGYKKYNLIHYNINTIRWYDD